MWAFGIMLLATCCSFCKTCFYQLRAEPENRKELEARIQTRLLEISALYKGFAADNKRGIVQIEFEDAEQRKQMLGEDIRRLLEKGGGDAQRLAVGMKERIEHKHTSRVIESA
uniref:DUF2730 family protein n=1 Tax=Globodera pallida TaxID=36090 RepID=A0A183BSS9_GLOPA